MTHTTKTGNDRRVLTAIIVVSVLLRIGLAFYMGDTVQEIRGGTFDQINYDTLAQRVVGGFGFSFATDWWPAVRAGQPTAFWSYLYTLYLTVVYAIFGHHPLIARLIQAVVVGLLMPWLVFRIARGTFGVRTGLIAAGITAIYFYFVLYAASLMTEAFYIVSILWTVDVAMRLAKSMAFRYPSGSSRTGSMLGLELGIAMAVALLLRQVVLVFFVVLAVWLLWLAINRGAYRLISSALVTAGLVVLVVISPFVIRNYLAFNQLAMPNTNAGFAFFWSNHPIYGTHFEPVLSHTKGVTYLDLIPPELRDLNEAQLDRALLVRGLEFVRAEPGRYLLLSLSRVPVYFLFWPTSDSTLSSNVARVLSFGLFLPFMLYGLILAIRDMRPGGPLRPSDAEVNAGDLRLAYLVLLLLFIVTYTLIHLASWANVRYRLPVDAFLILFAAYGMDHLLRRLSEWKNRRMALSQP